MNQHQLEQQAKAHSVILSICCVCEEVYGGGVTRPEWAGLSHGYCLPCYHAEKARYAKASEMRESA